MRRAELIKHLRTSGSEEYTIEHMSAAVAAKKISRLDKGLDFTCFVLQGKDPFVYEAADVAARSGVGAAAGEADAGPGAAIGAAAGEADAGPGAAIGAAAGGAGAGPGAAIGAATGGAGAGPGAAIGTTIKVSDSTSMEEPLEELKCLLSYLGEAQSTLANDTRYQVLYKNKGHWFTIDIALQDGKFSIFLIDTVNHETACDALVTIAHLLPDAALYYCGLVIQKDGRSCASFAFDHASCLARIPDLHQLLAKKFIRQESTFSDIEREVRLTDFHPSLSTVHCIELECFISELAPLLRNVQHNRLFEKNYRLAGYDAGYSRKTDSLKDKLRSDTEYRVSKRTGALTFFSVAISKVRDKVTQRTLDYLESISDEEFDSLLSNRAKIVLEWAAYSEKIKPESSAI